LSESNFLIIIFYIFNGIEEKKREEVTYKSHPIGANLHSKNVA